MGRPLNHMDVTVTPTDNGEEVTVEDVQYISFVSSPGGGDNAPGTYGIPALVNDAEVQEQAREADEGVRILYVNPHNIACMEVVRRA